MPPADQLEGVRVAGALESWGYGQDRALLLAGLLHDVGKSRAAGGARYRMAITLMEAFSPGLLQRIIRRDGDVATLWRHAEIGAEMTRHSLPADSVRLIRDHHKDAGGDERLRALQEADALF